MTRALLTVIALCLASPAAAQQPPAQPTPQLPPVVVEGTRVTPERTAPEGEAREEIRRTPGGVDLIGEQQIKESRGANLKDVLDFTPGVWIRPRFGAADESQISIRGSGLRNNFHLRGVNVLIDGFPYGNADGFADFESLELLDTKRVEVYKGANALRFGGFTLGGAINLVTKTGYDAGLVELRSEAGSFRLPQEPRGHRPGLRPARRLPRPDRCRASRLSRQLRPASGARLQLVGLAGPPRDQRPSRPPLREEPRAAGRRADPAGAGPRTPTP